MCVIIVNINTSHKSGNGKMMHLFYIWILFNTLKINVEVCGPRISMIGFTDVVGILSVKAFRVKIEFSTAFKWFLSLMKRINFHYSYSNNRKWNGTEVNRAVSFIGIHHFNGITANVCLRARECEWIECSEYKCPKIKKPPDNCCKWKTA